MAHVTCFNSPDGNHPLTAGYIFLYILFQLICISSIILIIFTVISFFCKLKNKTSLSLSNSFKVVYVTTCTFWIISTVKFWVREYYTVWINTPCNLTKVKAFPLGGFGYYAGMVGLYLLHLLNIHKIMKHHHLKYRKPFTIYFIIGLIIQLILLAFNMYYSIMFNYVSNNGLQILDLIYIYIRIILTQVIVNAFYLFCLFVTFQIYTNALIDITVADNYEHKNHKIGDLKDKIKYITRKYSVTSLFAMFSALFTRIAFECYRFSIDYKSGPETQLWSLTSFTLNMLLNVMCIYLQFEYADKIYRKLCCCMITKENKQKYINSDGQLQCISTELYCASTDTVSTTSTAINTISNKGSDITIFTVS
eukprot:394352_1